MKKTGAWLVTYALEQLPVKHTFGIPGVHVTELYDELNKSDKIRPILVTHEGCGAFMADGISRTSETIGTLVIVPAAGVTHAMSGIGEAYLDGIPMLIISGGTRRDSGRSYQLHQWDQHAALQPVTKMTFLIENHNDIVPTIFEAYRIATTGEPGPVFVEVPVEIQLFRGDVDDLPTFAANPIQSPPDIDKVCQAVDLLKQASNPGIFAGWGARDCTSALIQLAETLEAPVATTLQGLSVFPGNHPLHVGMGFGAYSVPAGENAFKDCDCLVAIGTRFSEIPTGSYDMTVPENLIHIDINPDVFSKNYPAKVAIEGDAGIAVRCLLDKLQKANFASSRQPGILRDQIKRDKEAYYDEWRKHITEDRVNPFLFFEALRSQLEDDVITVLDDGNHTFLTAELFPIYQSRHLITPSDFNCMGYCVPAAIGAKLVNPNKQVVGIVGDGGFYMTGLETLTASVENLGVIYFVFYDGELSQISQGQEIPYNRKTCTILGEMKLEGIAQATGAAYVPILKNDGIEAGIARAIELSNRNQPVIVDVRVDYSKRTRYTRGVVKANLKRFPLGEKVRFIGRAIVRRVTG